MEQRNNMQRFLKLIISSSEKKATENNMTPEQKKGYIIRRLFDYFERSGMKIEEILPIYKEVYPEFSQEDFMQYLVDHTSNPDIIFEEKLKVEKKLEKISSRIAEINKQLGAEENLSDFDLKFINFQQHESPINAKINQVKKKYELTTEKIKPKRGQDISEEQMQEYIDLIAEMADSSSSIKEIYEMAKEQIGFFEGMGDSYEDELRKKSPELFEYIDALIKSEVGSVMEEKQKLEKEKQELKKLESGFINMCKKYDTRLPVNLRGTPEERKQREESERRKKQQEDNENIGRKTGNRRSLSQDFYESKFNLGREIDDYNISSGGCSGGGCGGGGC